MTAESFLGLESVDTSYRGDMFDTQSPLLAIDVGGTTIKYGLYYQKQLYRKGTVHTPKNWESLCEVLKAIQGEYNDVVLEGVAMSMPGSVDVESGIIHGISALDYIHHFNIRQALTQLFDLPVAIENDANCAALAELVYGAAKKVKNCLFFIIGTGIGGAVVINRTLIKGNQICGGEFGLMEISHGKTLSELASPVQVAKQFAVDHGVSSSISAAHLVQMAQQGDVFAQEALDPLYDALATAIYNLSVALNPEKVLLGGGFSQNPVLIEELTQRIDQRIKAHGISDIRYELERCHFLNDANLVGASIHFVQRQIKEVYNARISK